MNRALSVQIPEICQLDFSSTKPDDSFLCPVCLIPEPQAINEVKVRDNDLIDLFGGFCLHESVNDALIPVMVLTIILP